MRDKTVNNIAQLAETLAPRIRSLVFMTGQTGAGKSTIASNMARLLGFKLCQPGKMFRQNPELMSKIIQSENPGAPEVTENLVRSYVTDFLTSNLIDDEESSIIIDGMPRTCDQVQFCVDISDDFDMSLVFVYVSVPLEIRISRLKKRDVSGQDAELLEKRLRSDLREIPYVIKRIRQVVFGGNLGDFYKIYNRRQGDNPNESISVAKQWVGESFR